MKIRCFLLIAILTLACFFSLVSCNYSNSNDKKSYTEAETTSRAADIETYKILADAYVKHIDDKICYQYGYDFVLFSSGPYVTNVSKNKDGGYTFCYTANFYYYEKNKNVKKEWKNFGFAVTVSVDGKASSNLD